MRLPDDIEAPIDIEHIDIMVDGEVVACVTIEVRKDMVKELGSPKNWRKVLQKTIDQYATIVPLMENIQ